MKEELKSNIKILLTSLFLSLHPKMKKEKSNIFIPFYVFIKKIDRYIDR